MMVMKVMVTRAIPRNSLALWPMFVISMQLAYTATLLELTFANVILAMRAMAINAKYLVSTKPTINIICALMIFSLQRYVHPTTTVLKMKSACT